MAASPRTVRITWERPPHHCNSLLEWRPRVVRVNFDFAFNANVSWTNLVQWDSKSELLGWSGRATWIMEPGNELVLYEVRRKACRPLQKSDRCDALKLCHGVSRGVYQSVVEAAWSPPRAQQINQVCRGGCRPECRM